MGNLPHLLRYAWVLIFALQLIVLATMTFRGLFRDLSALYFYICLTLCETPLLYAVYSLFGYQSWTAFYAAWIVQAVTVAARWLVVCQLCYLILGRFRGLWNFSLAILATCAGAVLILALAVGGHDFVRIVNTFDLSLELSIATTLAVFFAFARYYKISVVPALRSVGIALCLYSCFRALNDVVLQKLLREYANAWSLFDEITYVATLVLIAVAVFLLQRLPAQNVRLLPAYVYAAFVPQANERLSLLNDRLGHMLSLKGPKQR